jgi:hypothetical protein
MRFVRLSRLLPATLKKKSVKPLFTDLLAQELLNHSRVTPGLS